MMGAVFGTSFHPKNFSSSSFKMIFLFTEKEGAKKKKKKEKRNVLLQSKVSLCFLRKTEISQTVI